MATENLRVEWKLPTLSGVYSAAKTLYSSYMPKPAADVIEVTAGKLFSVLHMVPISKKIEIPSDLEKLDSLLVSLFVFGDKQINSALIDSSSLFQKKIAFFGETYHSSKGLVIEKVHGFNSYFRGKYTEVKPVVVSKVESARTLLSSQVDCVKNAVSTQVDSAKAAVQKKMEEPSVAAVIDKTAPYYHHLKNQAEFVKENVEPAKAVLINMAMTVKADIAEKGLSGYAMSSAESLKLQGIEAYEVCKARGAVEGVKDISSTVLASVAAKLEEAKKEITTSAVAAEKDVRSPAESEEKVGKQEDIAPDSASSAKEFSDAEDLTEKSADE